jgi:hypothetical protein
LRELLSGAEKEKCEFSTIITFLSTKTYDYQAGVNKIVILTDIFHFFPVTNPAGKLVIENSNFATPPYKKREKYFTNVSDT